MTMQTGILGNDQEVNWDQLIYAPNPDAYAPIQFTSSAEASLPSAQPVDYGYTEPASDTYSYAQATPDIPGLEPYGPPAPVEYVAPQEYAQYQQTYETPDFSYQAPTLPEYSGAYQSSLTPYGATTTIPTPVDPSMYDQFGFGQTGSYRGLTDSQLADAINNPAPFFQNPQFAESNAQFDYTTDPANRDGVGLLGGLENLSGGTLSAALTPIGPLADAAEFMKDAVVQNRSLANQVSTGGITGPVSGGNYYAADPAIVSAAGDLVLPQTPLDLALMGIPAALAYPKTGLYGALAEAIAFGPGAPIDALPDAAKLRGALQIPQYSDEAADLARRFPELAGQTPIPKNVPGAVAEQMPFGSRIAGAGDEVAQAVTKQAHEFAGNIRLSKYPEDIRSELVRWADENASTVETARRGTISNAETLASARNLVEDTGGNFDSLMKTWKPGEAWNAEEITALRGVLNEKTDAVLQAAKAVQEGATEQNQIALINALREQARIQEAVTGLTAEAGRALQSLRADAAFLASNPDTAVARSLVQQAGFDPDKMGDVAAMLVKAADNPAQVNSIIRNLKKPGLWDYLTEIWINSLLSGPMTHARNFISNMATTTISPVERGIAAAVDLPMSRIQGRQVERFFQEVPADAFGAVHGLDDGVRAALHTIRSGGVQPGMASKLEFEKAFKGPLGAVVNAPSTMLEASDALWTTVNYRAALSAGALRQARKEGLSGAALVNRIAELTTNPPEALIRAAKAEAEYRVFRAPAGEWTRAIMNAREKIKPLRLVIPFLRTPANLMKFGIERSPLGLLDPSLWRNVKAGNASASDQIARAVLGSSVAAAIAIYAGQDKITGPVPESSGARDLFYRMGKQPFSIKVGDRWVSYQQLEPLNQTFAQVSAAVQAIKNGDRSIDAKVTNALTSIGTNLVSQTYMTGLSDALNAIQDPDRYGSSFASRVASGFMPFSSALRTADRAVDTTLRSPEGVVETLKSNIPGLSTSIPARLDALGNEVQRSSPFYSPVNISQERISEIDAELDRLGTTVNFVGSTIGGNKLSREEKFAYQRMAGQMTEVLLDRLISDPRYASLPDEAKAQVIDDAIGDAREPVRDMLEALIESDAYQSSDSKTQKALMERATELFLTRLADRVGSRR